MWIVHSPGAAISLKDRCVQSSSEHPSRTERQQDLQAASYSLAGLCSHGCLLNGPCCLLFRQFTYAVYYEVRDYTVFNYPPIRVHTHSPYGKAPLHSED